MTQNPDGDRVAALVLREGVSDTGRMIGAVAGLLVIAVSLYAEVWLVGAAGTLIVVGALTARSTTTTVEHGALVRRFGSAPLRGPSTHVVPGHRIRGIEVLHDHDPDTLPGRADTYWVAVRLQDRRRPIGEGPKHYDRPTAEREASALRSALTLGTATGDLVLRVPATGLERATLVAAGAVSALGCGAALLAAGGNPIDIVWPLAGLALGTALTTLALFCAAASTGGTTVTVQSATRSIAFSYGVGHLGRRHSTVRFEAISGPLLVDEQPDGHGTVVLVLHSGATPIVFRGLAARHHRDAIAQAIGSVRQFATEPRNA